MNQSKAHVYTLSAAELRELQLVLLDMLIELDRICRKNNIRYCLDGGTLLGAVRHKGFIPWDDDLDVVITREEYIKLRKACETDLDENKFFFQDQTTDSNYRWGYGRLRRKNSEFIRVGQEHMKMKTGIFLDIFPRDNVPDLKIIYFFHNLYCYILRKLLYSETGMFTGSNPMVRLCYRLLYIIPASYTFKKLDGLAARCNRKQRKRMRTLTFPMLLKRQFGYKREWFEETSEIMFEGQMFFCAKDYHGYLKDLYGDYMTPPPLEKRHWHPVSKFYLPKRKEEI